MKKQQLFVITVGFVLLTSLFFFGKTVPSKIAVAKVDSAAGQAKVIDVEKMLLHAKERLTPEQLQRLTKLENSISRGDVKDQQIKVYNQLAAFWQDTVRLFEPYAYYTAESAKLENTEKSLTFAAHLFLTSLKTEGEPPMQNWLATNAKVLFEKALVINPANDSSVIGLGACYIFGNISDNPMTGIAPIRAIVDKNPDNVFGQFILGLGGVRSGQYDKAAERFIAILKIEPDNLEAMLNLAEVYDRKGDKENAIKWYTEVKIKLPNPEAQKELDARIEANKQSLNK